MNGKVPIFSTVICRIFFKSCSIILLVLLGIICLDNFNELLKRLFHIALIIHILVFM